MSKVVAFSLVCFYILNSISVKAQTKEGKIVGVVRDSLTLSEIELVTVRNATLKRNSTSGENGIFQIMANPNDTIHFIAPSFSDATYIVPKKLNTDTIQIWLKPKVNENLPGVFVSTYSYKDYQNDSIKRMKEFVENVGMKLPTLSKSNSGVGLGIGLDALFSKKNKQKKRAFEIFKEEEKDRYIDYRFNRTLVHSYTGLKGVKLQQFMHQYRPTYDWLRENTDTEALKYYINDRINIFFKNNK